jgi:hypothetical protein
VTASDFSNRLKSHGPLAFFLLFYYGLVGLTYRDFGIGWDEYDVYSIGSALYHFLLGSGERAADFLTVSGSADRWVDYDYFYGALLSAFNPGFSMELFHWLNFAFSSLVFVAGYEMTLRSTGKPWLSLLAPLFLFLCPVFLGQIPVNGRDVPFAVLYFLALSCFFCWRKNLSLPKGVLLGLLFGFAQGIRLAALSIYPLVVLFWLYEFWMDHPGTWSWRKAGKPLAVFLGFLFCVGVFSCLWMALTWPYLGKNFFTNFWQVLQMSLRYDKWDNSFLAFGQMVRSTQLPWYYLPGYLGVSIPLAILLFGLASPRFVCDFWKNRWAAFLALIFVFNLGAILIVRPVAYLGIRHFLFLIPILASLSALSAVEFFGQKQNQTVRKIVLALIVLNLGNVVIQMVQLHPYEYVYFNELAGGLKGAYGNFEIETLGISSKEAVEWLKQNQWTDPKQTYHVACYQEPFQMIYYLPSNVKYEKDMNQADYLISLPYSGKHRFLNTRLYEVSREGVPLMDIYKKEASSTP